MRCVSAALHLPLLPWEEKGSWSPAAFSKEAFVLGKEATGVGGGGGEGEGFPRIFPMAFSVLIYRESTMRGTIPNALSSAWSSECSHKAGERI